MRLEFTDGGTSISGKTKRWRVSAQDLFLGSIQWYGPWRKYVFVPSVDTLFDAGCLLEVAAFSVAETDKHKEGLRTTLELTSPATPAS